MGKRSNKERKPRDFYPTPYEPCVPLLTYLWKNGERNLKFVEPCAGNGCLITHFEAHGHQCIEAYDLEPQNPFHGVKIPIVKRDVIFFGGVKYNQEADYIITNPPWSRNKDGTGVMHEMIPLFAAQLDTWLLLDADWAYTDQAKPFLKEFCEIILPYGRVSWEGNGKKGKENCSWYLFTGHKEKDTEIKFVLP